MVMCLRRIIALMRLGKCSWTAVLNCGKTSWHETVTNKPMPDQEEFRLRNVVSEFCIFVVNASIIESIFTLSTRDRDCCVTPLRWRYPILFCSRADG